MSNFPRASGVLLHPTALPGPHGIGTLGTPALNFLNWLEHAGQSYWQICPLIPTGYGDSPYQGFSAFAGNPNLLDMENLVQFKLLKPEDLRPLTRLPVHWVDFKRLIPAKNRILRLAWQNFVEGKGPAAFIEGMQSFQERESFWLDDFTLFMVIKHAHGGVPWNQWPDNFRFRRKNTLEKFCRENADEIGFQVFLQYVFYTQWQQVRRAAEKRGIGIIGDLPIFVSYDSADCWAHHDLFQLDQYRFPLRVAGVPPDYYSSTGQLWGNPLYNWEQMEKDGFSWWISVIRKQLSQYDLLRVDHFRGFAAYWSVPFGHLTAEKGQWVAAPGEKLFSTLREKTKALPVIAEDLGVITPDVVKLIEKCGFPRMKVLQFAFDSSEENDYLPHTYEKNCVVYTGTHDNDTAAGWYEHAKKHDQRAAAEYLNLPENADAQAVAAAMVRTAMASVAHLAVFPLQDILGLGSNARFNIPGTLGGNWIWRADSDSFSLKRARELRSLTRIYGRLNSKTDSLP
ncbi:MAG: 4-alpha-glucanotransferase [Acidobacteria bacterium]|nr:MAG: 4-alpha-glucanotransferase [Acidobacteriota bacterium]